MVSMAYHEGESKCEDDGAQRAEASSVSSTSSWAKATPRPTTDETFGASIAGTEV